MNDVDHSYDFYRWYLRREKGKIYLFLHAWEYSIIALLLVGLVYYHPVLLGAALAHLGHISADHFHNRLTPWGYFITYRVIFKFDSDRIAPNHNVLHSYKSWPRMLPFGERLEPWYKRKIEPWFQSRISD